jgi:hypothetical protein
VGSRALYYSYGVPPPVRVVSPLSPNQVDFISSGIPSDCGPAGVALPAVVLTPAGSAPDFLGTVLLVHTLTGAIVLRSSGFTSNQPMLSVTSWTTAGSNPLQARWALADVVT